MKGIYIIQYNIWSHFNALENPIFKVEWQNDRHMCTITLSCTHTGGLIDFKSSEKSCCKITYLTEGNLGSFTNSRKCNDSVMSLSVEYQLHTHTHTQTHTHTSPIKVVICNDNEEFSLSLSLHVTPTERVALTQQKILQHNYHCQLL